MTEAEWIAARRRKWEDLLPLFRKVTAEANNIVSEGKSTRNASPRLVGIICKKNSSLNSYAMQKAFRAQTKD